MTGGEGKESGRTGFAVKWEDGEGRKGGGRPEGIWTSWLVGRWGMDKLQSASAIRPHQKRRNLSFHMLGGKENV